jgi:hypothetical protein
LSFPRTIGFTRRNGICVLTVLLLALATSSAQDNSGQTPTTNVPQNPTAPATPEITPAPTDVGSFPISGLDQPWLGPPIPARSFLMFGAHVSEAVDSNVGETSGSSSLTAETRALGSVMLQKIGTHSFTALDYVGGVVFYPSLSPSINQVHQFDGEQKFMWKRGQLTFRDQLSYLPEGSFGFGAYGESGASTLGLGSLGFQGAALGTGLGGIFTLGEFGSLGQEPRIDNLAIVDLDQSLSKRSAITLAGGYGLIHFTNDNSSFIDSNQIIAQGGYDYQVTSRTQIALVYGFQKFEYPNIPGSSFITHVGSFMYGHRISGRMDLVLSAGPQVTLISNSAFFGGSSERFTVAAHALLRYRFPRTSLALSYDRYNTSGSGYFLGAISDTVRFSVSRPLGRVWTGTADIGYSRNEQIEPGVLAGVIPSTTTSLQYVYAGAVLQRPLGHHFDFFVSYQFDDLLFDSTFCAAAGPCNSSSQRHVAAIGLNWHSRPIRLD